MRMINKYLYLQTIVLETAFHNIPSENLPLIFIKIWNHFIGDGFGQWKGNQCQ